MATHIAIGFSSAEDPVAAFREAAVMAKGQSALPQHDLAVVITTPDWTTPAGAEQVLKVLNPAKLIGLTAPAIIWTNGTENKGVAVLVITSDTITLGVATQKSISFMSLQDTAMRFARTLAAEMHDTKRLGAIVFCDAVALNHSVVIRGLQEGLGRAFSIAGAINPGGIFYQGDLLTDALGGIIIGGQTSFVTSLKHGWQPLGKPRIITDSNDNIIRKIDDKPAVSVYQSYFPEECPKETGGSLGDIGFLYPLGLNTERPKEYLIKTPTAILPDGSLVCQGDIAPGTQVHLMIGDKDVCRKAAHSAALDVRDQLHGKHPRLVLVFASVARKKLFGRSAWQEINMIKEILGLSCPVFGMYTYGEIGSATTFPNLQTHNASILIMAIG